MIESLIIAAGFTGTAADSVVSSDLRLLVCGTCRSQLCAARVSELDS